MTVLLLSAQHKLITFGHGSKFIFITFSETGRFAEKYWTQWQNSETKPVNVSGNMTHYLMNKAKDVGLGDFNRKDLIAATFTKNNGKGWY